MASARPNTSRPQPLALDSGVRKKPSDERGPKLMTAITQPQAIRTAGVRQPTSLAGAVAVDIGCL